jgi:hypothetical protein
MSSKRRRITDQKASTSSPNTIRASRRTSTRSCISASTSLNTDPQIASNLRDPSLNLQLEEEPTAVPRSSPNMPLVISAEAAQAAASAIVNPTPSNNRSNGGRFFTDLYMSYRVPRPVEPPSSPQFSLSIPSSPVETMPLDLENAKPKLVTESFKSDHSSHLLRILDSMRGDKSLCDYEIRVNGESFFCHKCILIAMSDFFRAMLTGSMKESRENFVELKGFTNTDGSI